MAAGFEYVTIDVDGHEVPLIDDATQGLGACRQLRIEIEDAKMDLLTRRLGEFGLTIASKHPVQNYAGLWNCIFVRRSPRPAAPRAVLRTPTDRLAGRQRCGKRSRTRGDSIDRTRNRRSGTTATVSSRPRRW